MTLNMLIELLGEYRDQFGGDAEVRLMTQQHWPFENAIQGVTSGEDINDLADEDGEDDDVSEDAVVYIIEGEQLRYGTKRAWETARKE